MILLLDKMYLIIEFVWICWIFNNLDRITFYMVSFEKSEDVCDSSNDHAKELATIIQNVKSETGQDEVNLVDYSKGGLDPKYI